MNKKIIIFLLSIVPVFSLFSCSESEAEEGEFANWQERNETYFNNIYAQAIASSTDQLDTIRSYSLNTSVTTSPDDYIVVDKLESGTSTSGSPMFTDSVKMSYRGRFIPTTNYTEGYVFDQTFSGEFSWESVHTTSELKVNGVVKGFTTALLNMRIGDRWRVYIPYNLGYGTSGYYNSNNVLVVPGYTTLIFDVALHAFYRPDAGKFNTKAGGVVTIEPRGEWITK